MVMKTALVVSNYNDPQRSLSVIESGIKTGLFDHFILVENGSTDDSYKFFLDNKNENFILLRVNENRGFSCGHNIGLRYACEVLKVDLVFIIASDIVFEKQCIMECIKQHEANKDLGIISTRLKGQDGSEQIGAWKYPTYWEYIFHCYPLLRNTKVASKKTYNITETTDPLLMVDVVRGSFMCFKAKALIKCGYFDENVYLYNEENIISKRMHLKNYKVAILTRQFYYHNHINSATQKTKSLSKIKENLYSDIYYMQVYGGISGAKLKFLIFSENIRAIRYKLGIIKKIFKR